MVGGGLMQLKLHHLLFDTVTTSFRSEREMKGPRETDGSGGEQRGGGGGKKQYEGSCMETLCLTSDEV